MMPTTSYHCSAIITRRPSATSLIPSVCAVTDPSTTLGYCAVASVRNVPSCSSMLRVEARSASVANTEMPPVMPSETRSVRRTVASTVASELTAVTGPIRLTIATAVSGSSPVPRPKPSTGLHLEQVGAERADLLLESFARRCRDAEHGDHRRDADGHADRRQRGAQSPGAQPERTDSEQVGGPEPRGTQRHARGRGLRRVEDR